MIAIVLHIYYTELWIYYKNKLESLDTPFDLYITLCDERKDISDQILKSFPTANIKKYKNKGQDIGPFLLTIKDIRHKDYNYLIKLHTKGFGTVESKFNRNWKLKRYNFIKKWRKNLADALVSSDDKIKENISILKDSKHKMVGSEKWHITQEWSRSKREAKQKYEFIGGTMFMVDFKFLKEVWTDEIIDECYLQMPTEYQPDYAFTHYVERQLGQSVINAGFKIKGV